MISLEYRIAAKWSFFTVPKTISGDQHTVSFWDERESGGRQRTGDSDDARDDGLAAHGVDECQAGPCGADVFPGDADDA